MKKEISKFASVTAGILLFTFLAIIFVGSYVLLGLWFVIIPAILGAFIGSERYDDTNKQDAFDIDEINYYVDPPTHPMDKSTLH